MTTFTDPFLAKCVSLDLEVDPKSAKIFKFAAVRLEPDEVIRADNVNLKNGLDRLEERLGPNDHIIGHNILKHDLPHLAATRPNLSQGFGKPIDTLWLNPLAYPRNPYHRLVKHHHDGRLQAGHVNDPERDARLVFEVLQNQIAAFRQLQQKSPQTLAAFHYLTTRAKESAGFDAFFAYVRGVGAPAMSEAKEAVSTLLERRGCEDKIQFRLERLSDPKTSWPMAYALSWISVAGGDSVMPPWVRGQFPEASRLVKELRDSTCGRTSCHWCQEQNNPTRALQRWFGFPSFRPKPIDETGRSLQERIVSEAMQDHSVLGILPTGTGKSLCYQIPALSKFEKTGALSVVISPLVALMADQVQGMERAGISHAVTINGMLSMPERQDALDKVRLGDAAILLISPEQLRSVSVRSVLAQREIGLWVLDEAHCVSKWGHDFRPDYRYIGRFIREFSGDNTAAPVLCLTATAKPEVIKDIREHFHSRLGADLLLLDGGAVRTNLTFEVQASQRNTKLTDILGVIEAKLPGEGVSGAIVYCATRKETERVSDFLKAQGLLAERYHAGLTPEEKRDIQERFRIGALRIIAATNAFGMGIDKPDIRLVVHGDIPGSLENYLQEAGRAGRDRDQASCVLLFANEDVERQFLLSARSRLARHEISAILKALRRLDKKTHKNGRVVATSGEIVRAEHDAEFERDKATDDTRVKTAISWLEETKLLMRDENRVQVYPSSLKIQKLEDAKQIIDQAEITQARRKQLTEIVRHLMNAPPDDGISTDELVGVSGLSGSQLNKALSDLEALGIAQNDLALTAFVHVGVRGHSRQRLLEADKLEAEIINLMREAAPDTARGEAAPLNLMVTCQRLRDGGYANIRPDLVEKLLRGMARDGRDQDGGRGNLDVRKVSQNTLNVSLNCSWGTLQRTAQIRTQCAERVLSHLVEKVEPGRKGKDIQVETTIGELLSVVKSDAFLLNDVKDANKLVERALLWLHEQEILTLGKGLTVFRPAMTVHLENEKRGFTSSDFTPLSEHYAEQTLQTHVMATYAEEGLESIDRALRLSGDYFVLDKDDFVERWLPGRNTEIRRQTTSASWNEIVDALNNSVQQKIVKDDREETNVLVLAGPGSGKTRVLVHRIAYLIRVKREHPRGILVLTYNRHAAIEVRSRLRELIGDDANGVTVSTCHALAMRLIGASFSGINAQGEDFDQILKEAVKLLNGEGLSKLEAEAQREVLVQGFRWILVDEYQDIGEDAYALISAVAGRSIDDPDARLSLFAVGDDDQNIYSYAGASVKFIRQFEEDYQARPEFLTENYRSTRHIIDAANSVICGASDRMKTGHDISINTARRKDPPGGALEKLDPVSAGRVQVLSCAEAGMDQAACAVEELRRLSLLCPDWDWSKTAIIARNWSELDPVRQYAESVGIPVEMANSDLKTIWRLREMQVLVEALRSRSPQSLNVVQIRGLIEQCTPTVWTQLIEEGITALETEVGAKSIPVADLIEWFAEWARETKTNQRGLLLLTAHRAKGLQFDHLAIVGDSWRNTSRGDDPDAPRRLFYVAMTRARQSLSIVTAGSPAFLDVNHPAVLYRDLSDQPRNKPHKDVKYQELSLKMVNLSWAGRLFEGALPLAAINSAKVGDPVNLVQEGGIWTLYNHKGQKIGQMARSFSPPDGFTFSAGKIGAVIRWRRSDNAEEYQQGIKREYWECVLPQLEFDRSN